jgi:hypothetical protein
MNYEFNVESIKPLSIEILMLRYALCALRDAV